MKLTGIWTVCFSLLALVVLQLANPKPIEQIRLIGFDSKILSAPVVTQEDVVLLNIGEGTLAKEGQYPFRRDTYARLIQEVYAASGGVIAFTIMFPEPDRFNKHYDEVFASWVAEPSAVVLAQKADSRGLTEHSRYTGVNRSGDGDPLLWVPKYDGIVTNIPELDQASRGLGMVNASVSVDGLTRRIPLVVQANDRLYPSLPLEIIRSSLNTKGVTARIDPGEGLQSYFIGPYKFKTLTDGSTWINWNVGIPEYEWGVDALPDLKGKTVIVGVTAAGIQNPVPTPAGLVVPHKLQGLAVTSLLSQDTGFIERPEWALAYELGITLIGSILIMLAVYYAPLAVGAITFVLVLGGTFFSSQWLWDTSLYLTDWTLLIATFVVVFSHASFNNFWVQFRLRQQIKGQFGTYLSPDMVDMLIKDPSLMKLGGDRKEMTFLFMDICGFTPISEFYKNKDDPEGLVELVNEFLDAMTKIILANGGTIDKYMGDCIMAFWNAPLPCANHAEMAVKSAIEIEAKTNELKDIYKKRGLPDINVGTGVNTGDCIVGNMGSESRFDYSVIGDAVNLAARLEATAARHEYIEYKTIYSSFTMEQLPAGYESKEIGNIKVKGKEELITIYSPIT